MWYITGWNEMEIFLSFKSNFLVFVVLASFLGREWQPPSSSLASASQAPVSGPARYRGDMGSALVFWHPVATREGLPRRVERSVISNLSFSSGEGGDSLSRMTTEFDAGFRTPLMEDLRWDPSLMSEAKQEVPAWKDRKQVAGFFSTASQK